MPDQNDADSVCYNLFAHYSVYRVTRDAVPARVPSPFNQHPNRWSWTCWNGSGTGPVDMGRCWPSTGASAPEGQQFENSEPEIYFQNCLTKSDPHPDTLFWHSFWHIIWTYMWHICSDILSCILFWDSIWHSFWHPIWHLFWHTFWNILYSDPALPWVWAGGAFICVDQCQWLEYPPNVGFTCLHPMIAITIDTPKWPGPEFESRSWKVFWVLKNRTLAQGLKKDVGGRFRYAVGLQSWVNGLSARDITTQTIVIYIGEYDWFYIILLVGGLEPWNLIRLSIQLGISSSQLTNSIIFQRGRSTTNQYGKATDNRSSPRCSIQLWLIGTIAEVGVPFWDYIPNSLGDVLFGLSLTHVLYWSMTGLSITLLSGKVTWSIHYWLIIISIHSSMVHPDKQILPSGKLT